MFLKFVAQRVVRHSVSVSHDRYSHARNCIGLPSNTALFSFYWLQIPCPLSTPLNPCDSLPLLLIQFFHAWRQSFEIEVFDLYSSSPWFQLLIVGHRYLLMNFHVVQFQYGFELIRLTYPQFVQTFQNIIRWNLRF